MACSPTIILVEDYAPLRRTWTQALTRRGYLVLPADTGSGGLAIIRELDGRPDLLIVDIGLPDMSGRAFVHHAARLYSGIPVLYVSGVREPRPRKDALRLRPNFLQKPFTLGRLERRMALLLPQDRLRTKSRRASQPRART